METKQKTTTGNTTTAQAQELLYTIAQKLTERSNKIRQQATGTETYTARATATLPNGDKISISRNHASRDAEKNTIKYAKDKEAYDLCRLAFGQMVNKQVAEKLKAELNEKIANLR